MIDIRGEGPTVNRAPLHPADQFAAVRPQTVCLLLTNLETDERLVLDLDDTSFHKCGRKVEGAGSFHPHPFAREEHRVRARPEPGCAHTLGPPAFGQRGARPAHRMRLYRKGGPSLPDLGQTMIEEVAGLLPKPGGVE